MSHGLHLSLGCGLGLRLVALAGCGIESSQFSHWHCGTKLRILGSGHLRPRLPGCPSTPRPPLHPKPEVLNSKALSPQIPPKTPKSPLGSSAGVWDGPLGAPEPCEPRGEQPGVADNASSDASLCFGKQLGLGFRL